MGFRYLIYRTDYDNTIVRESISSSSTGGTESELYTDFVIPKIQPLYLWKVNGSDDVVPNSDQNINAWLENVAPPISGDDEVTYNIFTGYTATTKVEIDGIIDDITYLSGETDNKMDKVNSSTSDNLVTLNGNGGVKDSGIAISEVTGSTGGGVGIFYEEYVLSDNTTESKPGSGSLILNNSDPSSVTEIYIDNLSVDNSDVGDLYAGLKTGDIYAVRDKSNGLNTYLYELTADGEQIGGSGNSGYTKLTVTSRDINGTIQSGTRVFSAFNYGDGGGNYVTIGEFNSYTGVTENRIGDIETNVSNNASAISNNSTAIGNNATAISENGNDIAYVSGETDQNRTDISNNSTAISNNATAIGNNATAISENSDDIAYVSGSTDGKQNKLTAGSGVNSNKLVNNDIVELDLTSFTANGNVNISITGTTDAVLNDLRTISKGFEYGGDYGANFTVRSLVDKGYVDSVAAGLDLKESVRVATTSGDTDLDLELGTFSGVIDGITLADGDRVLIKDQNSAKEDNGIYVYSFAGKTFSRAIDFQNPNVTAGAFVFISEGNINAGSGWVLVNGDPVDVGVDELMFTQFSSTGSLTQGVGIDITNGVISFDGASVAGDSISWSGNKLNIDLSTGNALGDALAEKLNIDDFNAYSASTKTRIDDVIDDITFVSGITDTKLDESIFNTYTGNTASDELFVIHNGGTDLNSVVAVGVTWDVIDKIGLSYSINAGGTSITINNTDEYEISFNIPFTQVGNNSDRGIGGNIVKNNTDVIDLTGCAGWTSRTDAAGSVTLSPINVFLNQGDVIDLVMFRTATNGVVNSKPNGSMLIKRKNRF